MAREHKPEPLESSMRAYTGYVKLWRQVFLSDFAQISESCSRREAWIELICLAEFEGPDRGTLTASERYLAQRWKWSRSKVCHFLKTLEKDGRIELKISSHEGRHERCRITICKYEEFQGEGATKQATTQPKKEEGRRKNLESKDKSLDSRQLTVDLSVSEAFLAWNELAKNLCLPVATKLTERRRAAIASRLKEHGREGWQAALAAIERSSFLRGQGGREGWKATLDFLTQASSFQKLIEGAYGNGALSEDHNSLDHYRRILETDESDPRQH